jgi:hypothetical protein
MPWQWSTVRGILSLQPPNQYGERVWTHRDVCLEATRQQGKTLIVVLLILFYLFVAPVVGRSRPMKIVYTAQRWSTAKDVFDRVVRVINRVPHLKRKLAKPPSTRANHGVIEVAIKRDRAGNPTVTSVVEFAPRSQEFGRGVTELDILFLDEAYDIDPGIENDLTGAQSASDNPQTIYLSTPPVFSKHPKCQSLSDMHRLGHAKAPHLFYRLFAAPKPMTRDDPATFIASLPSFGVAIDEREIDSKRQKAKTAIKRAIFDADYCGWGEYAPPETDFHAVFNEDAWLNMRDATPKLSGSTALALGRSPDRRTWVIAAGQRTTSGRRHLELGYSRIESLTKFLDAVVAVVHGWDPASVVINHQSAAMEAVPGLIAAGIEPIVANSTQVQAACGGFLNAAMEGMLSHPGQPLLDNSVASAVKRELPGGRFVWDLDADSSSAHLDAATLAHWALLEFGKPPKKLPAKPVSGNSRTAVRDETDVMDMAF